MLLQDSGGSLPELQSLVTTILAVSMAVERVVEILKQTIGTAPIIRWIFTPNANPTQDSLRCALIHLLSAVIGGFISALSGIHLTFVTSVWGCTESQRISEVTNVLVGLLAAGGSAFWSHALDLVKAAKVQKENTAKLAVATTNASPDARAVTL